LRKKSLEEGFHTLHPVVAMSANFTSLPWAGTVIQVTRDGMGSAPTELKRKLINIYFKLLHEGSEWPGAICFYAEGVRLVIRGADTVDALKKLEAKGVHLITCHTCLDYFGLTDQVAVGVVGGMHDILEAQRAAAKVVTL
jgi:hypothetical protein